MTQTVLPSTLYNASQVRELDRLAIEEEHIPGITLMTRAGASVYQYICDHWPEESITIFCGTGNNAGDGYVVATLAKKDQRNVQVIQLSSPDQLKGDAKLAYLQALESKVSMLEFHHSIRFSKGIIVDAMLGTGLSGKVKEPYFSAITLINQLSLPVLAIDIASGLSADTGSILGTAIKADCTISFIGLKQGLFTGKGPEVSGNVIFNKLGIPEALFALVPSHVKYINFGQYTHLFPPRPQQSHKGNFGHVLVIGGDKGFGGAVLMAAEAALRVGAGKVSVATREEHVSAILARRPEIMVTAVNSTEEIEPLLSQATVLVIGPGLGQSDWSKALLQCALNTNLPLILDADGLNLLPSLTLHKNTKRAWIMTPHPGEMARLLGISTKQVEQDRFAALMSLHRKYACSVMLKGSGSLVFNHSHNTVGVCSDGNPGMASGGMGDVLSGVIAGLVAQNITLDDALAAGMCLHSAAADMTSLDGERGMLATDLFSALRRLVNPE